jgi:hypothetical protein
MDSPCKLINYHQLARPEKRASLTFELLDGQAGAVSDNEAARRLNQARATMFKTIYNRSKSAA